MNGIGGNGFATIFEKKTGKVHSLSMAGAAPKALKPAEMTPETLNAGMKAGIVPGNLGGYLSILDKLGTMSLAEVFAPAIEYAEKGYPIDQMLAQSIDRGKNNLGKYPTTAKIFLPNGQPLKAGELLKNPDYAATLRKLVDAEKQALAKKATRSQAIKAAFDRFYKGDIAQEFERFFKENGGLLTAADLAAYQPQWTEPLRTTYRGYDVFSNPSTSRGGFEVLMRANLVERFNLASYGSGSPQAMHALIEAIKVSKADIYRYVADPKFTVIPTAGMLSKPYAASRSALIDMSKAGAYPEAGRTRGPHQHVRARLRQGSARQAFPERYDAEQHTTSFSIVDKFGNAIGVTPTLGGLFGNNVVVGIDRPAAEQRHAARFDVAVSRQRQLRRRRQDSDPQQLAGRGVEGRQARVRVRHARRRDDRPDAVPDARQPDRLPAAGAAGDRSAALLARCRAELLQARLGDHGADRESHAGRDDRGAEGDGPQAARAARAGAASATCRRSRSISVTGTITAGGDPRRTGYAMGY